MTRENYIHEIRYCLGERLYNDAAILIRRLIKSSGELTNSEILEINAINDYADLQPSSQGH